MGSIAKAVERAGEKKSYKVNLKHESMEGSRLQKEANPIHNEGAFLTFGAPIQAMQINEKDSRRPFIARGSHLRIEARPVQEEETSSLMEHRFSWSS